MIRPLHQIIDANKRWNDVEHRPSEPAPSVKDSAVEGTGCDALTVGGEGVHDDTALVGEA